MKQSELVRLLRSLGATFEHRSKHLKVTLNGHISYIPRHPARELPKGTIEGIKKQLKIK